MKLRSLFILVFSLVLVLPLKTAWSQEYIRGNDQGSLKILIKFMVVSEHLDAKALLVDDPEFKNGIDLFKYPDAKIHVLVEIKKTRSRYSINLCSTCYTKSDLNNLSFIKVQGGRRLKKVGDKTTVIYQYNPQKTGASKVKLSFNIIDDKGSDWDQHLSSAPITFKKGASANLDNLEKELEAAIQANDGPVIKKKCKEVYDLRDKGLGQSPDKLDQLVILCDETLTSNNLPEENDDTDAAGTAWNVAKERARSKSKLHERKKVYEDYLKNFPNSIHRPFAEKEIEEVEKKLQKLRDRDDAKIQEEKQRETKLLKRIGDNFHIEEVGREKTAKSVIITLECSNYEGKQPSLSGCHEDVGINYEGSSKWKITAPKNIECEIAAYIDGVNFTKGNNTYKINTKVDPVSATFTPQQDGAMLIAIEDGEPPYQLRFLQDDIVVGIMKDLSVNSDGEFILNKDDSEIPGSGKFTLQITDKSGNNNEKARSKRDVFNKGGVPWEMLLIPLGILIAGIIAFLLYRKWKQTKLSEEENKIIEDQIKTNTVKSGEEAVDKNNSEVRKNIKISKKAPATATSAAIAPPKGKELVTPTFSNHPKLRLVDKTPVVNELLEGTPDEYRRLAMEDLWEQSFVSNIYIHERVAYRIEQFVFKENRELLTSKGEKIPEIGGWLMGKSTQHDDHYLVSIERFIQIQRAVNTDTKLTFDAHAWQILERAKDTYRDENLDVVGWFHTHPGWGVFLSGEDINTHETYFNDPFHIAMEMESVKEPHDVGFFTRWKGQGKLHLNNRAKAYYRWEDFRNWLAG